MRLREIEAKRVEIQEERRIKLEETEKKRVKRDGRNDNCSLFSRFLCEDYTKGDLQLLVGN